MSILCRKSSKFSMKLYLLVISVNLSYFRKFSSQSNEVYYKFMNARVFFYTVYSSLSKLSYRIDLYEQNCFFWCVTIFPVV